MSSTSKQKAQLHYRKRKIAYIFAILLTIGLGLASRKWSNILPLFLAENAGDVLWAMMVFFGFRFLLTQKSLSASLALSFLFCFLIECSQLYQANWINQLRTTTIGALILGKGFLPIDLLRYSVGILIAFIVDKIIQMLVKKTK